MPDERDMHQGVASNNLALLRNLELPVTVRFGSTKLTLADLSLLRTGSAVTLDNAVTDLVEVMVGQKVIARGEPVVVQGKYGVRITEIASHTERLAVAPINEAAGNPE